MKTNLASLPLPVLRATAESMGIILGSNETVEDIVEQLEALESLCASDSKKFHAILEESITDASDAYHSA